MKMKSPEGKKNLQKKSPAITCGIYLYDVPMRKFLICHATNSAWNKWTIPKGIKDKNEDPFAAATRELKEETGVDLAKINVLKIYPLPFAGYKKQNKILQSFLVVTNSDLSNFQNYCSSTVNKKFPEIDNWKWVSPELLKGLLHESQQENLDRINQLIESTIF